ncbi:MAG: hypothetical protein Terrestrivirus6_68 [Terrestrivirus sp.]|uniref:Uncharacterized protein n=1 Tax=Terrestrivirus sp. TaxID=2487775 RepID=A0A3G4ZNI4_9VIRU|nr:MAG: hypothetical protein Terrestrivirus6_68 [Terrestrivirus sp.]
MYKLHPIYDLLTPEIVQLVRDIKDGKCNGHIIIFYGNGSNGKTALIELIKKILNYTNISHHCVKNIVKIHIEASGAHIGIMNDPDLDRLENKYNDFTSFNIPIIIQSNFRPSEQFLNKKNVSIYEFKNEYVNREIIDGMGKRQKLPYDNVVNNDAISILNGLLGTDKHSDENETEVDVDSDMDSDTDSNIDSDAEDDNVPDYDIEI